VCLCDLSTGLSLGLVVSTEAEIWITRGEPCGYESSALTFASLFIVSVASLAILAV
jgi:hypothetical protein